MATTPNWRFSQLFGEKDAIEEVSEVDIVSAIEFDETGEFLAVGDRGGRVVVFEQDATDYKFYAEFQSHEPEFDYLKSLEIEEKINKIKWCKRTNGAHFLLSTNDKTVKLWKLSKKNIQQVSKSEEPGKLTFPKVTTTESTIVATPKKVFANAHAYHINSISVNSDGETYISADDLRINLWNLEISEQSFNIVDIKPDNMEELSEVITSAAFHPKHCNLFMYSSSKGSIKLNDTRQNALCDQYAKYFEEPEDPATKSFFSEIISSISDCQFSGDGRYIISRDYLTLKIWDINMESEPLKSIKIHEHLRSKLCDLYENDLIFDKFECHLSADGSKLITGSYHNIFYSYDWQNDIVSVFEANKNYPTNKIKTLPFAQRNKDISSDAMDFSKKVLHMAYHPQQDIIAVGASNNLFLYEGLQD